jgi:AcrR family transcriptional regulator
MAGKGLQNKTERRERKDARRNLERVLEAARELFAQYGGGVTIEMVARRAGVGIGTVYRRFPSKEHLVAAISHDACHDTHRCLAEAADGVADPIAKLRALVAVHYRRSAQLARLLDLRGMPSGPSLAEQQQFYAALQHMLEHVIAAGQRQGAIRDGDPSILAALCFQLLHPRAVQQMLQFVGGDVETAAEHTTRFVLAALSK